MKKKAQAGACGRLSQDEAGLPLVPTVRATLGVQGPRRTVGTGDNKDQGYCFAALNVVTGQLTTRRLAQPARSQATLGLSQPPRLHVAVAVPLRDIAGASPASQYPEGVIPIDQAPWHRGALMAPV